MSEELSDVDRAHLEFLRQRMTEAEARKAFHVLGETLGLPALTTDKITVERYEQLIQGVVAQLRHWGNPALADRYQVAHAQMWGALKEQARFLRLRQERNLMDVERAQADAAAEAAEDASEDFERVQAEVSAYLKGLDEQGGA